MMPLWIFTLGRMIFERANLEVPYQHISTYVYSLIIPIIVGLLIQRKLPRIAKFLVRILKSVSAIFIIFIVVFAIVTNLYLFKLFTWQVSVVCALVAIFLRLLTELHSPHRFCSVD